MKITGNTILITGGGSGIGRALAEAFLERGNDVIVTGRNRDKLTEVECANPGIRTYQLDVDDPDAIRAFSSQVTTDFPSLNILINNAGIMPAETVRDGSTATAEATITTNLLGPIRLTTALLPHLMARPDAAVLTVSSGLAFLPRGGFPTYCASKAAIHSYSQTLRVQLRDTSVQVIELVPPYVQTELTGPQQAGDPNAMPLGDYISETMALLQKQPDAEEILVERVHFQRFAEREDRYSQSFDRLNG
ncbi:oxidoreductase [Tistrella bauzanensis]|uniref:Oxidoreductase n=1 Tax=Tistrella bauzanensis TaxID=657419 RepID=A0ABQ1IKH0_9PROT|nr:SDR family oxidoreductase [Tistrella bauzanensis]GGB43898.1 oxidoreductase [Tistrella bauzanensis]